MNNNALQDLSTLLKVRNKVDNDIAGVIGRPGLIGHIGEYIASQIFEVELNTSATQSGDDGYFRNGPLNGKTVNVKWYPRRESILDINKTHVADYYLVLTGPKSPAISSRGRTRPMVIDSVYLFEMKTLLESLKTRGVKIGVATSMLEKSWTDAEIYPKGHGQYPLNKAQKALLTLFGSGDHL